MTEVEPQPEPVVDPVTPEPVTPEPTPEPVPKVADKVREAGKKDYATKRSLDDLEPDVRKLVEDQVSAALSQKTQKGEYLTRDQAREQFKEDLARERAQWKAEADADNAFHTQLAQNGILPGTKAYEKIEAASALFDAKALVTEDGVNALIRAAGLTREQLAAAEPDSRPVQSFSEGPASTPAEGAKQYGGGGRISAIEARIKRIDAAEG